MCVCRRLVEYMDDSVTHVVTQQQWDDNFDQVRCGWTQYYMSWLLSLTLLIHSTHLVVQRV